MKLKAGVHRKTRCFFLVTASICFVVLLFCSVQFRGYLELSKDLEANRGELNRMEKMIINTDSEQKSLDELDSELGELRESLQVDLREGAYLIPLGHLMAAMGLEVIELLPEKSQEGPEISEIPLSITIRGEYPDLLHFFQEIEANSLPNATLIRHFRIFQGDGGGEQGRALVVSNSIQDSDLVIAELGLTIYTAKDSQNRHSLPGEQNGRTNIFQPTPGFAEIPRENSEGVKFDGSE